MSIIQHVHTERPHLQRLKSNANTDIGAPFPKQARQHAFVQAALQKTGCAAKFGSRPGDPQAPSKTQQHPFAATPTNHQSPTTCQQQQSHDLQGLSTTKRVCACVYLPEVGGKTQHDLDFMWRRCPVALTLRPVDRASPYADDQLLVWCRCCCCPFMCCMEHQGVRSASLQLCGSPFCPRCTLPCCRWTATWPGLLRSCRKVIIIISSSSRGALTQELSYSAKTTIIGNKYRTAAPHTLFALREMLSAAGTGDDVARHSFPPRLCTSSLFMPQPAASPHQRQPPWRHLYVRLHVCMQTQQRQRHRHKQGVRWLLCS